MYTIFSDLDSSVIEAPSQRTNFRLQIPCTLHRKQPYGGGGGGWRRHGTIFTHTGNFSEWTPNLSYKIM